MFSIQAELQALAARLHREGIPYALCGALALALHGYPRATMDIDLLARAGSEEAIRPVEEFTQAKERRLALMSRLVPRRAIGRFGD